MLNTLSECIAAGIPVYAFGSPELQALHESCRNPPLPVGTRADGWDLIGGAWQARRAFVVSVQVYGDHADGRQYVVDHGGFYTLNTLHAGQVCPEMHDIKAH